jgi:hypothetical protein
MSSNNRSTKNRSRSTFHLQPQSLRQLPFRICADRRDRKKAGYANHWSERRVGHVILVSNFGQRSKEKRKAEMPLKHSVQLMSVALAEIRLNTAAR